MSGVERLAVAARLLRALFQDLFREVVADFRIVVEHLGICVLEKLRVALARAGADRLLHAGITDLALPRRFFPQQLVDGESKESAAGSRSILSGDNIGDLARLQFRNGAVDVGIRLQLRFSYKPHVTAVGGEIGVL